MYRVLCILCVLLTHAEAKCLDFMQETLNGCVIILTVKSHTLHCCCSCSACYTLVLLHATCYHCCCCYMLHATLYCCYSASIPAVKTFACSKNRKYCVVLRDTSSARNVIFHAFWSAVSSRCFYITAASVKFDQRRRAEHIVCHRNSIGDVTVVMGNVPFSR